jgi:hypothetical protein
MYTYKLKNWIYEYYHEDWNDYDYEFFNRGRNVNWSYLSFHPNAISFLEKHEECINWKYLSYNPNAISLFEKNQKEIYWKELECYSII